MKTIPLGNGGEALVDDEDWASLSVFSWHRNDNGYVVRGDKSSGRLTLVRMHRQILGAQKEQHVDHINGNRVDNRRSNLRFCTRTQNMWNAGKHAKCTSKFKGVYWLKATQKWRAKIKVGGKHLSLGCFTDEIEAARAYNAAAKEHFGEYARLNLIP